MAVKKGNKILPITLTPFHQKKLKVIQNKTGLSATGVIQRLLEGHDVFGEALLKKGN